MRRILKWLKAKLGIPSTEERLAKLIEYSSDLHRRIMMLEDLYKNLAAIGVDVHFKEPHMILIFSHIGGGQIRHIPAHFSNLTDLNEFCRRLKNQFNTDRITFDLPHGCPKFFD